MAGTFSQSFRLVKESFNVLRKDRAIMLFPIITGIVIILLIFPFVLSIGLIENLEKVEIIAPNYFSYLFYLLIFLFYLTIYFVVIFFNVGLITCAYIRLTGGDPTFSNGFKYALKHIKRIFLWSLISATIGVIIVMIEKLKIFNRIIIWIFGISWGLLTFFILPVLIFENKSITQSMKKSGYLFTKTWGEIVVSGVSMGFFFLILGLIVSILVMFFFIFSVYTGSLIAISIFILTILCWIMLGVIHSSLKGIFIAACYIYAITGKTPLEYHEEIIKNAFMLKS